MKDLLLIQSLDLNGLIEEYRLFFLALMPSVFIIAVLVEFFAEANPFALVKRALISILLLVSVSSFYQQSIDLSMDMADEILERQKQGNVLLMNMLEGRIYLKLLEQLGAEDQNGIVDKIAFFFKSHLFKTFINEPFAITVFFLVSIFLLILKVVYSLVYYMGYGLLGIPCLLYLFPNMGRALYGGVISYFWCLVLPHVLVFVLAMLGHEINKGYMAGEVIGGSIMGTAFLFVMALSIAFVPLITSAMLNKTGIAQIGGIVAAVSANYTISSMRNLTSKALKVVMGMIFPKTALASMTKNLISSHHSGRQRRGTPSSGQNREQKEGRMEASSQAKSGQNFQKSGQSNTQASTQNKNTKSREQTLKTTPHKTSAPTSTTPQKTINQVGPSLKKDRPQTQTSGGHHGKLPKHRPRDQRNQTPTPYHHRNQHPAPGGSTGGQYLPPPPRKR